MKRLQWFDQQLPDQGRTAGGKEKPATQSKRQHTPATRDGVCKLASGLTGKLLDSSDWKKKAAQKNKNKKKKPQWTGNKAEKGENGQRWPTIRRPLLIWIRLPDQTASSTEPWFCDLYWSPA